MTETVPATAAAKTAAPVVVLGSKDFVSGGAGWGTAEPSRIYNGGDASGEVRSIHWTNWGQSVARGTGLHAIFKPGGGYYPQPVTAHLQASDVGTCSHGGPRAYLQLTVQDPTRPGGPLGSPYAWSESRTLCSYGSPGPASTAKTQTTPEATSTETQPHRPAGGGLAVQDFNGSTLAVKIDKVIDPATPADQFSSPKEGTRFVAIEVTLTNEGPETITSDVNDNMTVIGTDSQAHNATFASISECTNFSYGRYTLPSGESQRGCAVFQLPEGVEVKAVQFALGKSTAQFNR